MQILKILNLHDSDINANYKFISSEEINKEQSLESFLDDKNENQNELNKYIVTNPYNKTKTNFSGDLSNNKA